MDWRFLNTLFQRGGLSGWREALLPEVESFEELRRLPCAEINIGKDGVRLYRNSRVSTGLDDRFMTGPFVDLSPLPSMALKGERTVISVDKRLCLVRPLSLPDASRARTEAMLELELARVIPFARESVVASFVEAASKAPDGGRMLEQIVIRKDLYAGVVEALSAIGARPLALTVRDGTSPALPLALAPSGAAFRLKAFESSFKIALAGAAAAIAAGMFVVWAVAHLVQDRIDGLDAAIAEARADAARVTETLELQKQGSQALTALAALKTRRTAVLGAMEELSRLLPDDAYLDGMTVDESILTADGAATAPELLISELESSPLFENVVFAAPVFKNPGEIKSRFSIRLELSGSAGT